MSMNHLGSCPIMTLKVHIRRIWRIHWPYDRGCDACVQARGRTPARRRKDQESSACDLAADIMFVGGRHWKVLVLLMIQTGMIGMVVLGGDREKDVKSTVSVLNEIGVGGLSLEVATDNEAYLLNLMQRSLRESNCRGFHWRNISENRPGQGCRTCCGDHERRFVHQLVGFGSSFRHEISFGITSDGVSGGVHL